MGRSSLNPFFYFPMKYKYRHQALVLSLTRPVLGQFATEKWKVMSKSMLWRFLKIALTFNSDRSIKKKRPPMKVQGVFLKSEYLRVQRVRRHGENRKTNL